MSQTCRPAKCIEAIRVTLLDQCTLQPICDGPYGYGMGCIIEPNWTPEIEEGEESVVKDNCGNICLRDDRCDLTKRWNVEFKIKDPDKEFLSLIEGNPLIVADGVSIGVRQLSYGACTPYVFLEMWEKTDGCDAEGDAIYYRHVFPAVRLRWTGNEREGVFRILNIEGKTKDVVTDNIGTGPFADIPVGAIVGASASEKIDYAWFEDDFLPTVQCGAIDVPCPFGPGFFLTILTDGNEGTSSPDGSGVQVAQDSLGNYVVAANVDANDGVNFRAAVWRFLPDGTPDVTFGGSGLVVVTVPGTTTQDTAYGVAVDTDDDSIYVLIAADSGSLNVPTVAKLQSSGAIDAGFATAGFLSVVGAGSEPVRKGIFVESTGDIAVAYNVSFTGADMARFTSVGVPIDGITTYPYAGVGITNNNGDGLYALVLYDTGSADDLYLASTDINTNTNSYVLVPVPLARDLVTGLVGIDVDPITFEIFLAGRDLNVPGNFATVQFDSGLAIDLGYGVAGFASFASGAAFGSLNDIVILSGGDMIVSGWAQIALQRPVTARINGGGALVGTYGTGGVQIDNTIGPDTAIFVDTILEEGSGRAVHTGWYFDAATQYWTMIARTLLPDGSLDPTFG